MTADSTTARVQRDLLAGKARDLQMARVSADISLEELPMTARSPRKMKTGESSF